MKTTLAYSKSFEIETSARVMAVLLTGALLAIGCSGTTSLGGGGSGGSGSSSSSGRPVVEPATWSCWTQTCKAGEVCTSTYTEGVPSSMTYACKPMPAACEDDPTCGCLGQACDGSPADPGTDRCGCYDIGCFVPCVNI